MADHLKGYLYEAGVWTTICNSAIDASPWLAALFSTIFTDLTGRLQLATMAPVSQLIESGPTARFEKPFQLRFDS
ncbi:hypothetical protein [Actinoplanes philippinensis]|uniref:hypothetical protein n=1 Tax=Actinoplanes philippinensis TaxID=35752 RepID=UPI0011600C4D|nr:hypothetical protein [Actinoplanes philippinensis]